MKSSFLQFGLNRRLPWPFWVLGGLGILMLGELVTWYVSTPLPSKASSQVTKIERPIVKSEEPHGFYLGAGAHDKAQVDAERQTPSSPSYQTDQTIESTAIALANSDLKKATDWLAQIEDPHLRLRATIAISNEAIRSNPLVALNLAAGLQPSPQRDDLIRRGVAEWALADADKAREWAAQIEDETLRADAIACIATSWSDSNPAAAANLVLDELPEGRLQADTLVSIIQRWGQTTPQDAARWVEQFPEGDLKAIAEKNLLAVWSLRDAAGARSWKTLLAHRR